MTDTAQNVAEQAKPLGLSAQIAAVKREILMRERVYPSFVAKNKMKPAAAEYELLAMRGVLATLGAAADASGVDPVVPANKQGVAR